MDDEEDARLRRDVRAPVKARADERPKRLEIVHDQNPQWHVYA